MKVSKQARRDAKLLYKGCLKNGLLQEDSVTKTVQAVVDRKPRAYIQILNHLLKLVKTDIHSRTARIESADSLDDATRKSVEKLLVDRYGTSLMISFDVNPALIGGMRIQVGSDVYDASIRSRLQKIEESFAVK
ncbi:MAG: H(+)-transporting ATPase [Verrucomicrobia bacterium]|jgi:F-type H+-transporting ATPase subunit delta|nr:H(+)-transporting ATPase [Verrucomicrobiota bacterium]MBT4275941.1 H(+)-transporting ATPase [Verrucomicrobiota bacterium]MBT5062682.1 H(+)-transporting ATPase [Verrucomicrobiota bacterium]MBT5478009.1 H(+)-transporting ATPase [Verrucomicrobiota bacterium]MBT6236749.1 H(+)-transporting ATPase [Verrucomicrobiota bacterium]